ncbi:flagellin [Pseudorhodobacter sp. MZDSW-24AT]|uniref:flagellin n=1 Tax=Pseudorhodobacter sp. MZDSW-24AT TaxID=2052957 RepID=UPI000C1E2956|nr:flagellin [Pseudorhodobacter sp. MZDSW-24AT]PJF09892.1 flagellin [Pseudorhodobacter sp. MZDSW-24AT]
MSSILTNNGAMVALQTMKAINRNLGQVQSEISTGKSVGNAKDNAAVWAISKVMESDVKGFKGISDSLALGSSTVAVAQNAAETVTDLLTSIKGKIVAAQEANVDRAKIQTDIAALRDQINSVVGAAQFNGLNLLSNASKTVGSGTVSVLSSLDRSATGSVTASNIGVTKEDLGTSASSIAGTGGTFNNAVGTTTLNAATQTATIALASAPAGFAAGTAYALNIFGTDADNSSFTQASFRTSTAAASTQTEAAANQIRYVTREGDTASDVAKALANAYAKFAAENNLSLSALSVSASGTGLTVSSTLTTATDTIQVNVVSVTADAANVIGGGLEALRTLNVSTESGAKGALAAIEGLIQKGVDSAATFGSARGRIDTQAEYVSKLVDSLKSGIGSMVDANMEEASARLQALQVQQQLATQSLSIANQAPQNILALFR